MTVNSAKFRQVMGNFPTGVTVVTTMGEDDQPYGVTVNSFTSVSLDPLLVLVCLDNQLSGLESFQSSRRFAVNILSEDQEDISNYFATSGTDRSQDFYVEGKTGAPLLKGAVATLECELVEMLPAGDHTIFLGEVRSAEIEETNQKNPLLFFRGHYERLDS